MSAQRANASERPAVGISCYRELASWGAWQLDAAVLPWTYVTAIEQAGGVPVLLPPNAHLGASYAPMISALVLSGGTDIDPCSFGADAHPANASPQPARDEAELALLMEALEVDIPVLGICRGMELLNVSMGGDLVQHLPEVVNHDGHSGGPGRFASHDVQVAAGSRLASLVGEAATVNSLHHQGPGAIGRGLLAVAWAPDGSVEAIEAVDRRFVIGVLWHPEQQNDSNIFDGLVEAARARLMTSGSNR